MEEIVIRTSKREEIIDITGEVEEIVKKSKINEGVCFLFIKHATAALTINENYDPIVSLDLLDALKKIAPKGIWRHDKVDGNADAHIKSAIVGPDISIPIKNSALQLGTWQGVMLCEFDGPRERKVCIICK